MDFKIIKEEPDALQMDKNLIQIQKTIIYYNEKILSKLEELIKLIKNDNQKQEEILEKKYIKQEEIMGRAISQMRIPKGYKGN